MNVIVYRLCNLAWLWYSCGTRGVLVGYSCRTRGVLVGYSWGTRGVLVGYSWGTRGVLVGFSCGSVFIFFRSLICGMSSGPVMVSRTCVINLDPCPKSP